MREDMKKQIADTFSGLLEKENIDKITVTRLIEECHISRQTFYYHFHDIMDVLQWSFTQAAQEMAAHSLEMEDRKDVLRLFITFIERHRKKLERLLYSKNWVQIEQILVDALTVYLRQMIRGEASDIMVNYDDMEVLLRFFACGLSGVLLQYGRESHVNEEKLIRQLEKIITGEMFPGKRKEDSD